MKSRIGKRIVSIGLPLVVVAAGASIGFVLIRTAPVPSRQSVATPAPLVEAVRVAPATEPAMVEGWGEVTPSRVLRLHPEVGGRLVWIHPQLVQGGRIRGGSTLVRIEPSDFRLNVERHEAEVARAEAALEIAQGHARVASEEWKLSGVKNATEQGRALALRKPQLRTARSNLKAARAALEQARLQLARTRVRAPFDAYVQQELAEVGALVTPQTHLATLVGVDEAWVTVRVPVERLRWLQLPRRDGEPGSPARVIQDLDRGHRIERRGRVVRLLQDLDPQGRMARLVVAVRRPFATRGIDGGDLPLLVGAFARVQIEGRSQEELFTIPRHTLRDGQWVWRIDGDGRLERRRIEVVRSGEHQVVVRTGLEFGDLVVSSPLPDPSEGMRVEVVPGPEEDLLHLPVCETDLVAESAPSGTGAMP